MNRLDALLQSGRKAVSLYVTAGYPKLSDTLPICRAIEQGGGDLIEIGIPFSDPVADGPVIQQSGDRALKNGMTLEVLFSQLHELRESVSIPVLLMGYLNPVLQYGIERLCESCVECGVDGMILPDLPLEEYLENYQATFKKYGLHNVLLVSPSSSDERIRLIDQHSTGFIYAVSSAAVTGNKLELSQAREAWLARLQGLKLKHKVYVGFGIANRNGVDWVHRFADGAIIGSAFVAAVSAQDTPDTAASAFVRDVVRAE